MMRPDAPANDAPSGPVNPWIIAVAVTIATCLVNPDPGRTHLLTGGPLDPYFC